MGENKGNSPVYTSIYTELRQRIFSSDLKPGDLLPSENQLCTDFQTSRETVRKALKLLEGERLIYSKPKIGYFVCRPNHTDYTINFWETIEGCTPSYWDVHGILPDKDLQEKLQISPKRKVIMMAQLYRNEENKVVAAEIKYVPYERAYPSVEGQIQYAALPDAVFSKLATYDYFSQVEVSAVSATEELAKMLECDPGSPLLLVEQLISRQSGERVSYSRHYHAPGFNTFHATSGHRI